ncbi:MFS transporter [Brevundimonas sp.]|uniref:MFS transporter n=1 Tax=Brevundimonas sp. TaxID=1871086 RepID=UPI003D14AE6F
MSLFRFDAAFRDEFRTNWPVLLLGFSCLFFGFSAPAFALPFLFTEVIKEFGWTREQATLIASTKYLAGAVSALLVGRFLDITGVRTALLATLGLGGLALLSLLWVPNLTAYYIIGMVMGLAGPGAMVAVKVMTSRTFHASQGTATGIVLLGTSLGSIIVPLAISYLIAAFGWRMGFAALSAGIWLVALPMLLFFFPLAARRPPPDPAELKVDGAIEAKPGLGQVFELAKGKSFWILGVTLFIGAMVDQAFIQHQVLILSDLNMSREMVALAISAMGVVGIVFRILLGNLLDSTSNKGLSALYTLLTAASLLAFYLVNPFLLMSFVVLRAAGHAAILLDVNVMTKHTFGLKNFGTMIGVYTAIVSVGFATGPWVMGRLFDMYGNYHIAFLIFAILPLVGAVLIWNLKPTYWLAAKAEKAALAAKTESAPVLP